MKEMSIKEQKEIFGGRIYVCNKCVYRINSESYLTWFYGGVSQMKWGHAGIKHNGYTTWRRIS